MRAIVQRVTSAKVSGINLLEFFCSSSCEAPLQYTVVVDGQVVNSIGRGLCVLIGLAHNDEQKDIEFIVRKLINLRVFENEEKRRWDKSILDLNLEILCISQFTLYATLKGYRPDYHLAMAPDKAPEFYQQFMDTLKAQYKPDHVKDGVFGAYMQVSIENDGPVTITVDSKKNNED